jgi:hypothetical protein
VSPRSFGIEAITDEDRAYAGSRFSEVCEALFANPYQGTWGADGEPPLPVHPVTLSSLLYGILPFGPPYVFRQATERAVDSAADLRWGPDRKGFRRLVHPNGICLTGLWQITEDTGYSGYFRNGFANLDHRPPKDSYISVCQPLVLQALRPACYSCGHDSRRYRGSDPAAPACRAGQIPRLVRGIRGRSRQ